MFETRDVGLRPQNLDARTTVYKAYILSQIVFVIYLIENSKTSNVYLLDLVYFLPILDVISSPSRFLIESESCTSTITHCNQGRQNPKLLQSCSGGNGYQNRVPGGPNYRL